MKMGATQVLNGLWEYLYTAISHLSKRFILLYENTPVDLSQFDIMANNGYDISMLQGEFSIGLGAGIASITPPTL